jgi:hypothetical protein
MRLTPYSPESEAEHEEVPKEEAAVETFRALRKRHGDRHLAVRRRAQQKKRTQDNCGSRKKLAAARRGMIRRVGVAWRKGRGHTGPTVEQRWLKKRTRGNVARGTLKRRPFVKRRRAKPEGIRGIRNQSSRQQLRPRKETAPGNSLRERSRRQGLRLGSQKIIIWDPQTNYRVGGREVSSRDFQRIVESERLDIVEGSAPSEMEEETTNNSFRAMDVGALTTLRTFGPHPLEKQEGDKPGSIGTLSGSRSGWA